MTNDLKNMMGMRIYPDVILTQFNKFFKDSHDACQLQKQETGGKITG